MSLESYEGENRHPTAKSGGFFPFLIHVDNALTWAGSLPLALGDQDRKTAYG